jgi:phosphatidylglycerol:prolipoprotein diacylglycerol transferase
MTIMLNGYIHNIDPIIASLGSVHLWWYGLGFLLGFLNILLFLRRKRDRLGFSTQMVYDLTLFVTAGVLIGGRLIEVVFYEWPFYREHLHLIPAYWLGGMATHGLLFGGITGALIFCWKYRLSFLIVTDVLVVPAAFILGVGRIGNFIDGQIVGSVTDVWWAVKFPDAEGFRHPVVLYDGLKNLLLIPLLLYFGKKAPPHGTATGLFLSLYAFLRIFIDFFREYPTTLLGLATGQSLNIFMSALGLFMLGWYSRKRGQAEASARGKIPVAAGASASGIGLLRRRIVFSALALFSLTIPGDWTQDIPARYGKRHSGLYYSAVYPRINTDPGDRLQTNQAGEPPDRTIQATPPRIAPDGFR